MWKYFNPLLSIDWQKQTKQVWHYDKYGVKRKVGDAKVSYPLDEIYMTVLGKRQLVLTWVAQYFTITLIGYAISANTSSLISAPIGMFIGLVIGGFLRSLRKK